MIDKVCPELFPTQQGLEAAHQWLLTSNPDKSPKILFEQNRNLGDTLHMIPVIRHYRILYPNALMAFLVGGHYANAHTYNPDIDKIFCIPTLNPQERIELRRQMLTLQGIDHLIAPSIFPYGEIWKELAWSHENIATQYFYNAKIPEGRPLGGRKLIINTDASDDEWARQFCAMHNLVRGKTITFEYNSYSHQPHWRAGEFASLALHLKQLGVTAISLGGPHETPIKGTISANGITWRKTAALLNEVRAIAGIGSGLTMVAAASKDNPIIFELSVSDSITMKNCGYADSIVINKQANPYEVAKFIADRLSVLR